jgi:lactam utilization protein B
MVSPLIHDKKFLEYAQKLHEQDNLRVGLPAKPDFPDLYAFCRVHFNMQEEEFWELTPTMLHRLIKIKFPHEAEAKWLQVRGFAAFLDEKAQQAE